MSRWNHNICETCWPAHCKRNGRSVEIIPDALVLTPLPVRIKPEYAEEKVCCYCGKTNKDGIFVRENPESAVLVCHGSHPGDEE